jgi:hypothetical protein
MSQSATLQEIVERCEATSQKAFDACAPERRAVATLTGVDKVLAWAEAEEQTALALIDLVYFLKRQVKELSDERDALSVLVANFTEIASS